MRIVIRSLFGGLVGEKLTLSGRRTSPPLSYLLILVQLDSRLHLSQLLSPLISFDRRKETRELPSSVELANESLMY